MAYCRCDSESDVYMFGNLFGGYNIYVANDVYLPEDFQIQETFDELHECLEYLKKLTVLGLRVPNYTFNRIEKELEL